MLVEAGLGHPRVQRVDQHPVLALVLLQPVGHEVGEHHLTELRLSVGVKGRVGRLQRLQVLDEKTARVVGAAGDVHHPGRTDLVGAVHHRHQQPGEQRVAQVVDLVVVLEAVPGVRLLHEHHPCIVHQNVQRGEGAAEAGGKVGHRAQLPEIDPPDQHSAAGHGGRHRVAHLVGHLPPLALRGRRWGDDDRAAAPVKVLRHAETDAPRAAGDDGDVLQQIIGNVRLVGRQLAHAAGELSVDLLDDVDRPQDVQLNGGVDGEEDVNEATGQRHLVQQVPQKVVIHGNGGSFPTVCQ